MLVTYQGKKRNNTFFKNSYKPINTNNLYIAVSFSFSPVKNINSKKLKKLQQTLKDMDKVVVAYSGGADSTFLLKVAHDMLGKNILAVTAVSPTYTNSELKQAKQFTKKMKIRHIIIKSKEMENEKFKKNTPNRCYYCKKELFSKIRKIALTQNINHIIDGSNVDDTNDYRPGAKAIKEYDVVSPLKEAGLTKKEIRNLSLKMQLNSWNKPPLACLSSRLPYGTRITKERLKQIEQAESFLLKLGLNHVRVRYHDNIARIEVNKDDFSKIFKHSKKIIQQFKKLGFTYITLDIEGYRTGSLNEVLKE